MYKIGEFASLVDVNVKTLRYYDQINLLKPSQIDKYTNYRYYTVNELELFKKIEYLKKIGFTLDEIKNNINNLTIDVIESKKNELLLKQDLLIEQINELNNLSKEIKSLKTKKLTKKIDF